MKRGVIPTRKGVIQTQSVRQNVKVIVQTAPARRRRKFSTGTNSQGNIFEGITSQNLREGRKREGVSRAVKRYGSSGIHHVMPFEQLERIAGGTSSIVWNRNEPEQVLPRLKNQRPDDVGRIDRPYLKSRVKPEGGGKPYIVEEPHDARRAVLRSDTVEERRRETEERRRSLLRRTVLSSDSDD